MPRYFFDTDDGEKVHCDDEGLDFADDQRARDEASRALAQMASRYIPRETPQRDVMMWVRDEDGELILQLAMTFAIKPLR
jgi:hypothetical protein